MTHAFEGVIGTTLKLRGMNILNEGVNKGIVHDGWEVRTAGGRVVCNQLASI